MVIRTEEEMEMDYLFDPYYNKEFYGKLTSLTKRRVLVLGASHYCDGCAQCSNCNGCKDKEGLSLTQQVIRDYLDSTKRYAWKRTHSRFYNAIIDGRSVDRSALVRSMVFYNYLQAIEGRSAGDSHPEKFHEFRDRDEKCFAQLMNDFKPEVILVWGRNVRNAFPWDLFKGKIVDGQYSQIYHSEFEGTAVDICFCAHPSSIRHFKKEIFSKVFRHLDILK